MKQYELVSITDLERATLVVDIDAGPHRDARRIEARGTDLVVAQVFGIQRIGLVVDAAAINASIPDRDWATYTRERSIDGHG